MKILIVSTSDTQGGAAIAASRLMDALNANNLKVKMLVRDKHSGNRLVVRAGGEMHNTWNFYWERGKIFLKNRLSRENLFEVSLANTGIPITKLPEFREADVIHLHWINQGMLSVKEIGRILASGKKIVWTMHDMWPFTGVCHYAGTCNRYQESCGSCPYLVSASQDDLSHTVFHQKQSAYASGNITFVACSNWLRELAGKGSLTKGHRVISVPNPIDTTLYLPKEKNAIRERMHLPKDMKIVLFAAMKASDKRKGMDYLMEAARLVAQERDDILFLIAGANGDEIARCLPLHARSTGFMAPADMLDLYNAADVFVTPSLQDNLPNTIMESMACGTPCVGFSTGGIPEMIDHRKNGYVAEYKNAQDLADGLIWTLFDADPETLSANAREKVLTDYTQKKIAQQYISIYAE